MDIFVPGLRGLQGYGHPGLSAKDEVTNRFLGTALRTPRVLRSLFVLDPQPHRRRNSRKTHQQRNNHRHRRESKPAFVRHAGASRMAMIAPLVGVKSSVNPAPT